MYVRTYVRVCVCMYVCVHVCMYACILRCYDSFLENIEGTLWRQQMIVFCLRRGGLEHMVRLVHRPVSVCYWLAVLLCECIFRACTGVELASTCWASSETFISSRALVFCFAHCIFCVCIIVPYFAASQSPRARDCLCGTWDLL